MSTFAETSFLCSTYRADAHSSIAIPFLQSLRITIGVSTLVLFEFRQSLRLQNFHHAHNDVTGTPLTESQQMMSDLQQDLATGQIGINPVDWPEVHELAESLSAKHTPSSGHRFADILHVATALQIGATEFLTFDIGQRTLAEAEGLVVPL